MTLKFMRTSMIMIVRRSPSGKKFLDIVLIALAAAWSPKVERAGPIGKGPIDRGGEVGAVPAPGGARRKKRGKKKRKRKKREKKMVPNSPKECNFGLKSVKFISKKYNFYIK